MNVMRLTILLAIVGLSACGKVRYVPGEDGASLNQNSDQTGITTGKSGEQAVNPGEDAGGIETGGGATGGDSAGGETAGGGTEGDGSPTGKIAVALTVSPSTANVPRGVTQSLRVEATMDDGSLVDVTEDATYVVADETILKPSIAGAGIFEGVALGSSDVTITFQEKTTKATITVTDAVIQSLAIDPASATVPTGLIQYLQAVGTFSDGSTRIVTPTAKFTIDNAVFAEFGQLRGEWLELLTKAAGSVNVVATFDGKTASALITIIDVVFLSLRIEPSAKTLKMGEIFALKAIAATQDDGDFDVTTNSLWTSSDEAFAKVTNSGGDRGVVRAIERGSANITATFNSFNATSAITVLLSDDIDLQAIDIVDSLKVKVDALDLAVTESRDLQVLGQYSDSKERIVPEVDVTWSSSNPGVISVDATGLVKGVAPGSSTVMAKVGELTDSVNGTVKQFINIETQAIVVNPSLLDMVWLVDNSPSMSEEIAQVRVNIKKFTDFVATMTDINVHVISAKTSQSPFVQTLDVPVQANIFQYDFVVDSLQPAIIGALATCPTSSNYYVKSAPSDSRICDVSVTNFWGAEKSFAGLNGLLSARLRSDSRRAYVMVTDDDLITNEFLRKKTPGATVIDNTNFLGAVTPFGGAPTVYAFAGLTANGCSVASEAKAIRQLAADSGGDVYDICAADWSANFDKLQADVQFLKFALGKANVTEIVSVKQGGVVIPADKYTLMADVLAVHITALDTVSTDPLVIEYAYIP